MEKPVRHKAFAFPTLIPNWPSCYSNLEFFYVFKLCPPPWRRRKFPSQIPSTLRRKVKGSPYSITERRVPELMLIPVLSSQRLQVTWVINPAVGCHFSARPTVTLATLKMGCYQFRCLVNRGTMGVLPDSIAAAIWTQALLRLSPAR